MNQIERNKWIMIEKKVKKYVIANADTGDYLKAEMRNKKYSFVSDIEGATKTMDMASANIVLNRFYSDVFVENKNLVIIPIQITYELLEAEEASEKTENDIIYDFLNMINSKPQELELRNGETAYIQWD